MRRQPYAKSTKFAVNAGEGDNHSLTYSVIKSQQYLKRSPWLCKGMLNISQSWRLKKTRRYNPLGRQTSSLCQGLLPSAKVCLPCLDFSRNGMTFKKIPNKSKNPFFIYQKLTWQLVIRFNSLPPLPKSKRLVVTVCLLGGNGKIWWDLLRPLNIRDVPSNLSLPLKESNSQSSFLPAIKGSSDQSI